MDTGLPATTPTEDGAWLFRSRGCQKPQGGEFKRQPWAGKVNDGGFIFQRHGRWREH